MWRRFKVELEFTTPFASGTPKNPKDIETMLEVRMPTKAPPDATPIPELAEQVAEEVGVAEEGVERGHATFKRDEQGLYYEARCVRAHIKDCANALQGFLQIKALKAKVAQRVYVEPEKLYLGKEEPDDYEIRIVHAFTPKGMRSSLKKIDFVREARLTFYLKLLDDRVIGEDVLNAIFEYGGTHGMGQERSQDWGRYKVVVFEEVLPKGALVK